MARSWTSQVVFPKEALVEKCISEGKSANRSDDIIQYSMSHSGGYIYVYVNNSADQTLNEKISFEKENLVIEENEDQEEVELSVGPGDRHVISLKKTG